MVDIFGGPHICKIITFLRFYVFQFFSCVIFKPCILVNFKEISSKNRV